jgi:Ca-activated chloride channel family protein
MRLLDALEDAGDLDAARALGRALRARPDADATLRTAVGELYLRLAARRADAPGKAEDEAEARRAFGEIVEFAPDDPVARRRLGDLLRAHGWFEDASRQYETLSRLAPDDASVALLLAAAAEGNGRLEAAVKWTEKAGAASAPSDTAAVNARAFAATYLAWGRLDAVAGRRTDEVKAITTRLRRVVATEQAKGARVVLLWAHPELHPTLASDALGALLPAREGDVTLGIAQAMLPDRKADRRIVVRVPAEEVEHAARLGAKATLTVIFDEGSGEDTVIKLPITFTQGGPAERRFTVRGHEVIAD